MCADVSRFHNTFFEESEENLQLMEKSLLEIDPAAMDDEQINSIFRAAHSIKGGAGSFGFTALAQFTHEVETLLDRVRAHKMALTADSVSLLLRSVDAMRNLLEAVRHNIAVDSTLISSVEQGLQSILGTKDDDSAASERNIEDERSGDGWKIGFRPHAHLLKTGNDPLRLFSALAELGDLTVTCDAASLPALEELDPESCYLNWTLDLQTQVTKKEIEQVFDWVSGDCELSISPLVTAMYGAAGDTAPQSANGNGPVLERRSGIDRRQSVAQAESSSIRVNIDKVDSIINMVGELVITQSMLDKFSTHFDLGMIDQLRDGLVQLARNTRELQESVLKIRMMPISFAFNRFPRLVHDLSSKLQKRVDLKITGEQTELDKTVIEKISDPLTHLVRNSLDHGIEGPEQRRASGKPENGTIHLSASHEGGNIKIEVRDDGAGLDREKILAKARERGLVGAQENLGDEQVYDLLFLPGFSTAAVISDISGRGVGLDVVRRNIKELGGRIEVQTQLGSGTTFTIRLPLTLSIMDGQLVLVDEQTYIVPLISIVESVLIKASELGSIPGGDEVYRFREDYLPIVRLHSLLGGGRNEAPLNGRLLVVVEADGRRAGLLIDDLSSQQQIVIKSLETNYRRVDGISGATILGDGRVALILDVPNLIRRSCQTRVETQSPWNGHSQSETRSSHEYRAN